jgi:RpiB/LacA/LacB family sugar-phosphate isomerase
MKIGIGADHGGFELKQALIGHYGNLVDYGTDSSDSCDYADIANAVCQDILSGALDLAVLVCGTGIGISIAANRHKGIRAALLYSDFAAEMARRHNNANIAVFGGRTMSAEEAIRRFDLFLAAKFEGGRHERRIEKLDKL